LIFCAARAGVIVATSLPPALPPGALAGELGREGPARLLGDESRPAEAVAPLGQVYGIRKVSILAL
jgi:hypothetical protein